MDWTADIEGVFFDMDGTLLDSEHLTDRAIQRVFASKGLDLDVDCRQFHGVTWKETAEALVCIEPRLVGRDLAEAMQESFHGDMRAIPPKPIAGAVDFVQRVARRCGTALVSSSERESVAFVLARLGLQDRFSLWVCAGDVQRSKPAPDCYLEAAARLQFEPARCLVFEDSQAGVLAAKAAGMHVIAVGRAGPGAQHTQWAIDDFTELPEGFAEELGTS